MKHLEVRKLECVPPPPGLRPLSLFVDRDDRQELDEKDELRLVGTSATRHERNATRAQRDTSATWSFAFLINSCLSHEVGRVPKAGRGWTLLNKKGRSYCFDLLCFLSAPIYLSSPPDRLLIKAIIGMNMAMTIKPTTKPNPTIISGSMVAANCSSWVSTSTS